MDRAEEKKNVSERVYLGINLTKSKDMLLFSVLSKTYRTNFWYFDFWFLFLFLDVSFFDSG